MAQAPLWAKALKGIADVGTMAGNGLLLGQGALVKGTLGYAGDNLAKAAGLREGDYTPLADYIQQGTQEIADAREGSGSVGALAELGGGLFSGGAVGKLAWNGAKAAPAAIAKLLPKTSAVGAAGPVVPKTDIGKLIKGGMGLAGAGLTYSAVASGAPELSDFTDAQSSAVLPPKDGSSQLGAAATEKAKEPQLTKGQQMMINALSGMSFDRAGKLLQLEQIGATKAPSTKDMMLQRLNAMLDNERLMAIQSGVDPRKANADYLRNAGALVAPAGVPFLTSPEE